MALLESLIVGGISALGSLGGGLFGASAAADAAETQVEGALRAAELQREAQREAIAAQREMFDLAREDLAPYRQAGRVALRDLTRELAPGGYLTEEFAYGPEDFTADPGYQFRLAEGMKALERAGAARGMSLSGRQLKALQRFGQGMASDEYSRAYTRAWNEFQGNRGQRFNRLASLAGLGQTGTLTGAQLGTQTGAGIGQTAMSTGRSMGELQLQAANARASGYAGRGRMLSDLSRDIGGIPLQLYALERYYDSEE